TEAPSSATINVRSNCPVLASLMRKYVDRSIGQRTPLGMYTKEPSVNTALLSALKKLSCTGTTEPKYFWTSSGWLCTASEMGQKITPNSASFSLYVVTTLTLSKTASTATPAKIACSASGIPNFSYVLSSSGSTSLRLASFFLGAE